MRSKLLRGLAARLAVLCLSTAGWFGWKLVSTQREDAQGDAAYEALAELVNEKEPGESPAPSAGETTSEDQVPLVNLEAVQEENEEIVAWLYCPDTVINYPICYGTDNQYYLTHLADRTNNRNGSLFIDCNNSGDFSDDNTIIYGHHMSSGKMFASLVRYASQSYYQAHPVMYLTVGETRYRLELFAGYTTTADSDAYSLNFGSEEEKDLWLQEVSARSDFTPNQLTLCSEDRIVTLSTCAYSFPNARYVVHGKLTEF